MLALVGAVPIARFLYFYAAGEGTGHLQSLVLAGVLMTMSFVSFVTGLLADVVSRNRQLLEMTLEKVRRIELQTGAQDQAAPATPKKLRRVG
jgi:ABC-type Fe3+-siderophore transport system permease subunit